MTSDLSSSAPTQKRVRHAPSRFGEWDFKMTSDEDQEEAKEQEELDETDPDYVDSDDSDLIPPKQKGKRKKPSHPQKKMEKDDQEEKKGEQKDKKDDEQDKKEDKEDKKEEKKEDKKEKSAVPLLELSSIKEGQILCQRTFMKVTRGYANGTFGVRQLRTRGEQDWTVRTTSAYEAYSADQYQRTESVTQTEIANLLASAGDRVFTVTFHPVLKEELMATHLDEHKATIQRWLNGEVRVHALACLLLDSHTKTIRGRLLEGNMILGYSLVDLLDEQNEKDPAKPVYREINHKGITELIMGGVKYVARRRR